MIEECARTVEAGMTGIQDLSEDVLEHIILQLPPYQDLENARLVCRQWERVCSGAAIHLKRLLRRTAALTWEQVSGGRGEKVGTSAAAERCSHSAIYHPQLHSVFIFGGCTNAYTTFNDLWRFHCGTRRWERLIPSGSFPSPKACASLAIYNGKLILFGGWSKSSPNPIHQTSIFFNELHVYDPAGKSWRSVDSGTPHLAGHSVSVLGHHMVVFGGSAGSESSNNVWVLDLETEEWSRPAIEGPRPLPRYGQYQVGLSEERILVVGGCGGPNLIFNDAWLLSLHPDRPWTWEEVRVTNPHQGAPQLWSHPACRVGDRLLTLSKSRKSRLETTTSRPQPDSRRRASDLAEGSGLLPPRRKLLTSRSLDEKEGGEAPTTSAKAPPPAPELQRAQSIPAIIVGEIPKLVVTSEPPIALAASSLLPHQSVEEAGPSGGVRPPETKQARNRAKQLAMLQKMEDLMRAQRQAAQPQQPPGFRPNSPPPSPKYQKAESVSPGTGTRMEIYALDLTKALTHKTLTWTFVDGFGQGPEDRILYSLVEGRGELIVFGGMRNGSSLSLGVESPFAHPITNHTFILRPPIPF